MDYFLKTGKKKSFIVKMFCCFLLFHVVKRDQNIGDEPTLLLERCSHPHAAQHETVFVFIQDVCPPEESSSVRLHLISRRNIVEWLMTRTCSLTHQLTSTHRPTGLSEPMDTDSNNERPEENRSNAVFTGTHGLISSLYLYPINIWWMS